MMRESSIPLLLALSLAWLRPAAGEETRVHTQVMNLADLVHDARVSPTTAHHSIQGHHWYADGTTPTTIVTRRLAAPVDFSAVGAHWQGDGVRIDIAVDASPDRWYRLELDPHGTVSPRFPDGRLNPAFGRTVSSLQTFGSNLSREYRLRVTLGTATQDGDLSALSLVFLDGASGGPAHPPGADSYPMPDYYDRNAWGASPPNCNYDYCTVTHLGLHHTASSGDYGSSGFADCAANVRSHQAYHMNVRGWCDIGYNFLVCKHGKAWEGRGGDDVRGAHDGHNCGSLGTAAMGYFHAPYNDVPTQGLLDMVADLFAWKADQRFIDPHGRDWYSGYGGYMDNIYGHRNVGSTACPGDLLYATLDPLRTAVSDRIDGDIQELVFDNRTSRQVGDWAIGNTAPGRYGSDYRWTSTESGGTAMCYWPVQVPSAGTWELYAWWPEGSNRSDSALLGARVQGTTHVVRVNQRDDGGQWNYLGAYYFPRNGRSFVGVSNNAPPGSVVIADAMRLVKR